MNDTQTIHPDERTWAAIAHLSGLAGYLIPLGGVIVPVVIIVAKSDSPVISTVAKQALVLNIAVFVCLVICLLLFLTILLIPVAWILTACLSLAAIVLPIIGAVKAYDGYYFRYPIVGRSPYYPYR